jgi:hypothetical protein
MISIMKFRASVAFIILLLVNPQIYAYWGLTAKTASKIATLTDNSRTLPDDEIVRLSKLSSEVKGTSKVGKELGKLNLPNDALEDAYLRIAIYQNKITRHEAEGMYSRLNGTPGFRTTLRKITGNNPVGTIGHMNELKIADTASAHGFRVVRMGERFLDKLKKASTDIDILLERNGKRIAIEAKDYSTSTIISVDKYRADLDTLVAYRHKQQGPVITIFTITNKPANSQYLKRLLHEANIRNIQLIFGSPIQQVEQIKLLESIL